MIEDLEKEIDRRVTNKVIEHIILSFDPAVDCSCNMSSYYYFFTKYVSGKKRLHRLKKSLENVEVWHTDLDWAVNYYSEQIEKTKLEIAKNRELKNLIKNRLFLVGEALDT